VRTLLESPRLSAGSSVSANDRVSRRDGIHDAMADAELIRDCGTVVGLVETHWQIVLHARFSADDIAALVSDERVWRG
jgi:hypothetical protein